MGMRVLLVAVSLVVGFGVGWVPGMVSEPEPRGRWVQTIFDDDPRWDCRTMGDRVCGPDIYKTEGL